MTNNILTKYGFDKAGAIFASAFTSTDYTLTNYKYIDFIVASGEGEQASITAQIYGKSTKDDIGQALPFRVIGNNGMPEEYIEAEGVGLNIGGNGSMAVYRITADDLSKGGFDRVALKLTAATESTVIGSVTTVRYEPRYTE
ncbi:MAG TPA: hypothetical protein VIL26_04080 [Clostridia bacterium]